MDDKEKCPIIPTFSIKVLIDDENYLLVSPTHDTIQVFPEMEYNYLRYYDAQTLEMKAYFFDNEVLADLFDEGIPVTRRESITEEEYNLYAKQMGKQALSIIEVDEVPELMPGDPIDTEVQKAHEHLEEELDYLFNHGGIEDFDN